MPKRISAGCRLAVVLYHLVVRFALQVCLFVCFNLVYCGILHLIYTASTFNLYNGTTGVLLYIG